MLVPATIKQLSSVVGHPFYNPDFARYRVAIDGVPLDMAVTADCINGYAHKIAITPVGAMATEVKYGKVRPKVVRIKGDVRIFEVKEEA
jgi:hypothetical protein